MQTIPQYAAWCIPLVAITFDDGWASQQQAFEYAAARGVNVTSYIVSDWIGTANYLTAAQIVAMDAAGWDIGNHTTDHTRLTDLPDQATMEAHLSGCKSFLDGLGLTRASAHAAYPWGSYLGGDNGATTYAAMAAAGMLTGRTTSGQLFDVWDYMTNAPYRVPSYIIDASTSLATAKGYIDAAIANQQVVCLYLHNFTSGTPTVNEWTYADWEALIDYIVTTRIPALTISQLYALGTGSVEYTPTG